MAQSDSESCKSDGCWFGFHLRGMSKKIIAALRYASQHALPPKLAVSGEPSFLRLGCHCSLCGKKSRAALLLK